MDAPIVGGRQPRPKRTGLVLGHTQVRILRELAAGEIVSYERLMAAIGGQSQNALQQVVSSLRLRFGWDVIETHMGKGYSAGPTLERLLR
jgi:DNA-binding response OmpR family regulator